MQKQHNVFKVGVALSLSLALSGCVDDKYDLKDVNYTLGTNADLTFPACSTGDILMKNIMDLKEDGVVQVVYDSSLRDSIFCVKQSGNAHVDPVKIKEIRITQPTATSFHTTLDVMNILDQNGKRIRMRNKQIQFEYQGQQIDFTLVNKKYLYKIGENDAKYDINVAKASNISNDVLRIESVEIESNKITLDLAVSGVPAYMRYMHADGLNLKVPSFLSVDSCHFQGKAVPSIGSEGTIELTKENETTPDENMFDVQKGMKIEIYVGGLVEGEDFQYDRASHSAIVKGSFSLLGTIRLETDDFDMTSLLNEKERLVQFYQNGNDYTKLVPEQIDVNGEAAFAKDIVFKSFTGDLQHVVNSLDPIKLNDLPDFVNDPEVVLDLDNPLIFLTANNEMASEAKTQLTLTSKYSDAPSVIRETQTLTLKAAGITSYYLASKETSANRGATFSKVEDLGGLIRKIPKQIDVAVDTIRMHCQKMDLQKSYNVSVDYDVYAPLTFGPKFQLVYRDSERGWVDNGDLKDLEKVDAESLTLKAKAVSNLPADVLLTLIPLDRDGNRIPQLLVNEVTVNKNTTTDVQLTIKPQSGYTINDAFAGNNGVKKLDGITYEARVKEASTGETLRNSAAIKLTDAKISIKGKVTYDAN